MHKEQHCGRSNKDGLGPAQHLKWLIFCLQEPASPMVPGLCSAAPCLWSGRAVERLTNMLLWIDMIRDFGRVHSNYRIKNWGLLPVGVRKRNVMAEVGEFVSLWNPWLCGQKRAKASACWIPPETRKGRGINVPHWSLRRKTAPQIPWVEPSEALVEHLIYRTAR